MTSWLKGIRTTPENPGHSKTMRWLNRHLDYKGDECLIWPFGRGQNGYAYIGRPDGMSFYVHRFMCERRNGPPPSPEHIAAHSCHRGTDGCINQMHLDWKTPSGNQFDRRAHERQRGPIKRHKLTAEQVAEIRSLRGIESMASLSKRFGVKDSTLRHIFARRTWTTGEKRIGGFTTKSARVAREKQRASIPATESGGAK